MKISIVVAVDEHGTIGNATGIPWHLPNDLKRFKKLTMGKPILMGRTTHEHIGKPLPGRTNIVLSRQPGYAAEGCLVAKDLTSALEIARSSGASEAMVVGGGEIYREALPLCNTVYLTLVKGVFPGNVHFPVEALDTAVWLIEHEEHINTDAANPHESIFRIYRLR